MKSRKIVFIILAFIVSLCIIISIVGAFIVPKSQRASTFGVTDKEKSALVVYNKTSEFYILAVEVKGEITHKFTNAIWPGDYKAFVLPPGDYKVTINYSDRTSFSPTSYIEWYVDGDKLADFTVKKGRAVIYALKGGDVKGMFYDPPTLEDNSRELNLERD
jgi:hypothetical protein